MTMDTVVVVGLGFASVLIVIVYLTGTWYGNRTTTALVNALQAVNSNKELIDRLEALVLNTVPIEIAQGAYNLVSSALDMLTMLTPDDIDELLDEVDEFAEQITDGEDNDEAAVG